jgi:hypothetical protein
MVDAKQLVTRVLSWFRPGAVRPAVVCSRHCISQHRGACSGAGTSKAGEEEWPPSPCEVAEDVVGELENKRVEAGVVLLCVLCSLFSCPLRRGSSSSFYRPRRERVACMPRYLATWGSVVRRAVE